MKSCFVIMGFGIKNNIDLDLTYNKIIKPCIIKKGLVPFPIYEEERFNAYRCDEISGSTSIDYKFVTCLNGADIVIADISTMNINAIYELGARHALKPRSTILLCSKEKEREFKFFDITYVPIIFYEHDGLSIQLKTIHKTQKKLNEFLDFAINSTSTIPDNPIQRALMEQYDSKLQSSVNTSVYQLYKKGKSQLDNNNFDKADKLLHELYLQDSTDENLLLWSLAKYKKAEKEQSCKKLIECLNLLTENIDIANNTSEYVFGRLAAICLRIFKLSHNNEYYYYALEYYRKGAIYSKKNLYCARNYCAMLIKIHEITEDINIIKEYCYTAKHYAKLYLNECGKASLFGNYTDHLYHQYNIIDLKSIIQGEYLDYEEVKIKLQNDSDITERQRVTILEGIDSLKNDLDVLQNLF